MKISLEKLLPRVDILVLLGQPSITGMLDISNKGQKVLKISAQSLSISNTRFLKRLSIVFLKYEHEEITEQNSCRCTCGRTSVCLFQQLQSTRSTDDTICQSLEKDRSRRGKESTTGTTNRFLVKLYKSM
jgi:hypothetical protein